MADAIAISAVERDPDSERSRYSTWIELAIVYGLILAVIWSPRPLQRALWIVAAMGTALIFVRSRQGRRALGLRARNLGRSSWIVAAASACAGIAVLVAARLDTLRLPPGGFTGFIETYVAYAIWAGVQQLILQGLFLLLLLRVLADERYAALTAAGLFAFAHIPSLLLVPITLVWGLAACLHFLRYRNLFPLTIAHAILGIAVAMTIPGPVDHNMRVGLGYLTYKPHPYSNRLHPSSPP